MFFGPPSGSAPVYNIDDKTKCLIYSRHAKLSCCSAYMSAHTLHSLNTMGFRERKHKTTGCAVIINKLFIKILYKENNLWLCTGNEQILWREIFN